MYVELADEEFDVWRRVEATEEADGSFRLPDRAPEGEHYRFRLQAFVRCSLMELSDGEELVVSELVR